MRSPVETTLRSCAHPMRRWRAVVIPQAVLLAALVLPAPLRADEGGMPVTVLAVPKDSASQKAAATADYLARGVFKRNPRYQVLDLEAFLDDVKPEDIPGRKELKDAKPLLEAGTHALDDSEYATAVAKLTESILLMERGAAHLEDFAPYLEALLKRGTAYQLNADPDHAREDFKRALVIDRGVAWDKMPEQAKKLLEEVGTKVDALDRSSVQVFTTPAAAEIYVDGQFRGPSPVVVDRLTIGTHLVRVVHPGYRSTFKVFKVSAVEDTLQFALKPCTKSAELENITARIHQDVVNGSGNVMAELSRFVRTDQVFVMSVQSSASDVRVVAALVDGTGQGLQKGERSFAGDRFRQDMDGWLEGGFRTAQTGTTVKERKDPTTKTTSNYEAPKGGGGGGSPGRPKIILGALLLPTLPCSMGCGVVSLLVPIAEFLYMFLIQQIVVPPQYQIGFSANYLPFHALAWVPAVGCPTSACICTLCSTGFFTVGILLISWGSQQQATMDDVLAGAGGDVSMDPQADRLDDPPQTGNPAQGSPQWSVRPAPRAALVSP